MKPTQTPFGLDFRRLGPQFALSADPFPMGRGDPVPTLFPGRRRSASTLLATAGPAYDCAARTVSRERTWAPAGMGKGGGGGGTPPLEM